MSSNCQWDRTPKAHKVHKCDVCGIEIPKGVTYHKQSGIQHGQPYTFKAHPDCVAMYWDINKEFFRYGDEPLDVYEFDEYTVETYRGHYPHVVTRMELMRHRWSNR